MQTRQGVTQLRRDKDFISSAVQTTYDRLKLTLSPPPWARGERFGLTFVDVQSVDDAPAPSFGLFKRRSVDTTPAAAEKFEALGLVKRVSEVRQRGAT